MFLTISDLQFIGMTQLPNLDRGSILPSATMRYQIGGISSDQDRKTMKPLMTLFAFAMVLINGEAQAETPTQKMAGQPERSFESVKSFNEVEQCIMFTGRMPAPPYRPSSINKSFWIIRENRKDAEIVWTLTEEGSKTVLRIFSGSGIINENILKCF